MNREKQVLLGARITGQKEAESTGRMTRVQLKDTGLVIWASAGDMITWIPVEKMLPVTEQLVLITIEYPKMEDFEPDIDIAYYDSIDREFYQGDRTAGDLWKKVTAWMPLPAPYREGHNE